MIDLTYPRSLASLAIKRSGERLGQGIGIVGLFALPLVTAVVTYVAAVRAADQGVINPGAFTDAVANAVVTGVVWVVAVGAWSFVKAPSELHEAATARLTAERDAQTARADDAVAQLRSITDDLAGSLTLSDLGRDIGHIPGESTFAAAIGITLMNSAGFPIRYEARALEVSISGVASSAPLGNVSGFIPPFGGTATHFVPSVSGVPWSFPAEGSIAFAIAYGVRTRPPSYEYQGSVRFAIAVPSGRSADDGVLSIHWRWQGEPAYVKLTDAAPGDEGS